MFFTFTLLLSSVSKLYAQPIKAFYLEKTLVESLSFSDSLNATSSYHKLQLNSAERLILDSISSGLNTHQQEDLNEKWLALDLINLADSSQSLYLNLCTLAKKIRLYAFADNHLLEVLESGSATPMYDRAVLSPIPYLPIHINSNRRIRLIVCSQFSNEVATEHFTEIRITSMIETNHTYMEKAAFQFFFTGIMALIVLISLISSFILKNRGIFYYGMLTFFFIPYFIHISNINFLTHQFLYPLQNTQITNTSILFIIAFAFLFVSEYLQLKRKMPRYYLLFAMVSSVTLISTGIGIIQTEFLLFSNLFIALWLLVLITPSIILSFKKDHSAKILLGSFMLLVVGAIIFSLQMSQLIDLGAFSINAFQIGSMLFSFVLFYALANRISTINKERIRMEEMDVLKTKFFQDISHELRTPLTLINDPIKHVLQELPEGKNRQSLVTAQAASQKLQLLVNDILELSTLESSKPNIDLKANDIIPTLKTVLSNFETIARDKGIRLAFVSNVSQVNLNFNEDKMQKLIGNLFSNALKFTPPNGYIELSVLIEKSVALVEVKDSGAGIAEEYLPYIFDRYYQIPQRKNTTEIGSGIGLALVKEWTLQHSGNISVSSTVGKGTSFKLRFPIVLKEDRWVQTEKTVIEDTNENSSELEIEKKAFPVNEHLVISHTNKPVVLIVEDHPDLRKYLHELLEEHYKVVQAKNGNDGIDIALDLIPDLIISDLMMPEKNGYEVTETLKMDKRTSHIPIILLTARAGQEDKNRGLENGADDYLLKPFDRNELKLRIANLLAQRKKLQEYFIGDHSTAQHKPELNTIDTEFIKTIRERLKTDFANANFEIEDLADSVAMSKAHMNRKLKALMGISAGKMIQVYRLKKAKELLEKRQGTVGDIAHLCGFNSTAYFVKCYKEKYGATPGTLL